MSGGCREGGGENQIVKRIISATVRAQIYMEDYDIGLL